MPGDTENILAMEKFDGLLKSVKCEDNLLTLTFEDDAAFAYAHKVWDWVNGADNHNFLMVAGKGDCGDNRYRIPYLVSKLDYDEAGNVARLTAKKGTWKELIHSYELRVGQVPLTKELGLSRRDYTKDDSLNLHTDFQTKLKVKTGNVFGEFNCNPCGTEGSIKFEFIAKTKYLVPVDLVFKMYPENVKAEFILNFEFVSDFGTSGQPKVKKTDLEKRWTLGKIPLAGVAIPGDILTLGPVIDFQVGIEYAGEMGLKLSTGGKASLPNSAIVEADLLHSENNKFSGWVPQFDAQPLKLEGRVSARSKTDIAPTRPLEGRAIGFGFGTGLRLQLPYLEFKTDYNLSPGGGACDKGDEYQQAVRARFSWGYELKFTAGKINGEQNVDVTLGSSSRTIFDNFCIAEWDKFVPGQKSELPGSSTPPTPGPGPTPPAGGKPPNTCTANGKSGTCIDKSTCKGTTTTGKCLNDPDNVLCCTEADATPPPPGNGKTPNTCTANGKSGTCIDKSTCKGTTTTGKCLNDPDNVLVSVPNLITKAQMLTLKPVLYGS
ncbi:hypothetical protein ABVK25_012170 [Lepraria finkii]|uniref:Uncharacterized protein n=1 Tax=Lepraria finkii TaxID=1340010 RepID=A0ABR4AKI7_9LECA